jgi:hypothetical protein
MGNLNQPKKKRKLKNVNVQISSLPTIQPPLIRQENLSDEDGTSNQAISFSLPLEEDDKLDDATLRIIPKIIPESDDQAAENQKKRIFRSGQ